MVFSSLVFMVYFLPITLIIYFMLSFSITLQNYWLLLVSLVFYAWGEPIYISILIISILFNYLFGIGVGKFKDKNINIAKVFVVLDLILNLGILFVFKYLNFFIQTFNSIIQKDMLPITNLKMPIGISFFTFQALSYVIDVYRKDAKVQKNPFYMGLYIAFFPQLVAGPIVRYNTIENQIRTRKITGEMLTSGICRFSVGLSKKILISNNLAVVVDKIYELTATGSSLYSVPVLMAWIGAIGYMLQIYFDFSAYSDMAIGLGQVFGFQFEENFNYPYISKSIGEFWRRWHISLGTWFKEYVYFPLGGSRVENQDFMVRNTIIVWILTGLWHGASFTFVLWGLYNFMFIILERALKFEQWKIHSFFKLLYSNLVVLFGWVLFRSENLYLLKEYVMNMFGINGNSFCTDTTIMIVRETWMFFVPAILFSAPIAKWVRKNWIQSSSGWISFGGKCGYIAALSTGVVLSVLCLIRGGYNPFIYFNF